MAGRQRGLGESVPSERGVAELNLIGSIRNVIWRQFLSFHHEQGDGSHEDYDDRDGDGTRRIL
jgi:hypothetical protein